MNKLNVMCGLLIAIGGVCFADYIACNIMSKKYIKQLGDMALAEAEKVKYDKAYNEFCEEAKQSLKDIDGKTNM